MNDRIDFVCTSADHRRSEPNDALTMYEDRWAYCSAGADHRHDWQPTGGMSLDDAKRLAIRPEIRSAGPAAQPSD
jgi:hypothetical protein